jgi:hypothetical protein
MAASGQAFPITDIPFSPKADVEATQFGHPHIHAIKECRGQCGEVDRPV